jgi:hypothetical protein
MLEDVAFDGGQRRGQTLTELSHCVSQRGRDVN